MTRTLKQIAESYPSPPALSKEQLRLWLWTNRWVRDLPPDLRASLVPTLERYFDAFYVGLCATGASTLQLEEVAHSWLAQDAPLAERVYGQQEEAELRRVVEKLSVLEGEQLPPVASSSASGTRRGQRGPEAGAHTIRSLLNAVRSKSS